MKLTSVYGDHGKRAGIYAIESFVSQLRRWFGVFLFSSIDTSNLTIRLIFLFVCLFSENEREQQTNKKMTLSWLLPRRLATARVVIGRSFSAALSSSSSSPVPNHNNYDNTTLSLCGILTLGHGRSLAIEWIVDFQTRLPPSRLI